MAQTLDIASSIERVDVYRTGALVTRRAALEADRGELGIRISGLPVLLHDDSVRVAVVGERAARVTDLHVQIRLSPRDTALRTEAADALRDLMRESVDVEVERRRVLDGLKHLESLAPADVPASDLPESMAFQSRHQVGAWLELAGHVRDASLAAKARLREITRKRRDQGDRIAAAEAALERESQAEVEALAVCRKAARLQLFVEGGAKPVELEVSYLVPASRWVPEYELRVGEQSDDAELVLKALVAQLSGEDWPRVEMQFSTADLRRSAELPELDAWRIGKVQPRKPSGWRELPETLDELFEGYDSGVRLAPVPQLPPAPRLPKVPRLGSGAPPAVRDRAAAVNRLVDAIAQRQDSGLLAGGLVETPEPITGGLDAVYEDGIDAEAAETPDEMALSSAVSRSMPAIEMTAAMPPPAAGPLVASKAAPPRRKEGAKKRMTNLGRGAAELREREEEAEALAGGVAASRTALTYGRLRMCAPPDPRLRGRLEAIPPADALAEQLRGTANGLGTGVAELPPDVLAQLIPTATPSVGALPLPQHAVPLESSAGHFATRYRMEGAGAVPADGQLHGMTLVRRRGAVKRLYRCVPSLDTEVYQVALFENPLDVPLLAGPARIYKGGDFVVTAPLETTPPGALLTVNLGVEPNIKVARNTRFSESTSGLFGGGTVLEHQVEIEVRSRLPHPCRVELFERVPVGRDDEIDVRVVRSSPQATEYDQRDRGRLIRGGWKLTLELEPNEPQTCVLAYQITIPSKHVLVGGNRRD